MNEIEVEVVVKEFKKSLFFPNQYHGTVKVYETIGKDEDYQSADFKYDAKSKKISFDNYSRQFAPRHNSLGQSISGVIDYYKDSIIRRLDEEIQAVNGKHLGPER